MPRMPLTLLGPLLPLVASGRNTLLSDKGRGFPYTDAVGDARRCRFKDGLQISSTQFWRKAGDVAFGYPASRQKYVRWLALKLSGALSEAFIKREHEDKYTDRFCGNSFYGPWMDEASTLVGLLRLQNVARLVLDVAAAKVPGDFVEIGVWRGGTCIFAKVLLDILGEDQRVVHLFDAFGDIAQYKTGLREALNVRQDMVEQSFEAFQANDDMVRFHKGLFKDTLRRFWSDHSGSDLKIAILRIDANFYDGHQDALYYLYNFVPVGGYVIFDDLFWEAEASQAWREFRYDHNISEEMIRIDRMSGYFRKTREVWVDPSKMRRV